MSFKHMSASDLLKQKIRRMKPANKRKRKLRYNKNKKASSDSVSWSSKTRSYTRKDPNVRRTMRMVAKFRRKV